jgi:hypothetical protein
MEYRSIIDVSKQIINIIPKNETQLINRIENFIKPLWNQAPELLISSVYWTPFLLILNEEIPIITEDWQIKIRILINKE